MIKELEIKEQDRVDNLVDAGTMTFMTMNSKNFNQSTGSRSPRGRQSGIHVNEMTSSHSRASGSMNSASNRGKGKQIGGGGRISNRLPPTGLKRGNSNMPS